MNQFNIQIIEASLSHVSQILPLFQKYRNFYGVDQKPKEEESFLRTRLEKKESIILLAIENETVIGFTQLYPSFSSLSLQKVWILNDLYVEESHRKKGVGYTLLEKVKDFAIETKSKGLTLTTSINNASAQNLYEKFGFIRNDHFYEYFLFF